MTKTMTTSSMTKRINAEVMRHEEIRKKIEKVRAFGKRSGLKIWKIYDMALDLFIKTYIDEKGKSDEKDDEKEELDTEIKR